MSLQPTSQSFADHPQIRACLERHGFESSTTASVYTNGRVTIHFEETLMKSIPGDGSRTWQADLSTATPQSVVALLDIVLASTPFRTQAELDRHEAQLQNLKQALDQIAETLRENPESQSSRELRRCLWSLYNPHHVVNLWTLRETLDLRQATWVQAVLSGWLEGHLSEDLLKTTLIQSGEMDRWDTAPLSQTTSEPHQQALAALHKLLGVTPPGPQHVALKRVLEQLESI